MELSDEQKKKIREEELARLAEEQYRTQVRQEMRNAAPREVPEAKDNTFRTFGVIVILVLAIAAIVWYWSANHPSGSSFSAPAPAASYIPKAEKLFSNQVTVRHGQMLWRQFKVDTSVMNGVRVVGKFRASGGSGSDIQAVLADEDNFENWKNGHQSQVLYSTDKTTIGEVNTPILNSGTYFFCFSNTFSAITDKDVFADVELRYNLRR